MGIFHLFKPKKQLTPEQLRWNRMWTLWSRGEADSPYAELMTYQGEVTNGGHGQYFSNTEDLSGQMRTLESILPEDLAENLRRAYDACNTGNEDTLSRCDAFFCENEDRVSAILKEYAATF